MRLLMLVTILSMLALPAFAQGRPDGVGGGRPDGVGGGRPDGVGGGRPDGVGGGRPGTVRAAPIPLAGAGLPALGLALGAYALVRTRQRRKNRE
jgi:hypothetical protein